MYKLCNETLTFDAGYDFKFCSSFMFGHLFLISEIHEHVQGDALSGLASHDASPRTGPHAERDVWHWGASQVTRELSQESLCFAVVCHFRLLFPHGSFLFLLQTQCFQAENLWNFVFLSEFCFSTWKKCSPCGKFVLELIAKVGNISAVPCSGEL